MHLITTAPLEAWGDFYLILGGAAAALTGLQFVVITLVADAGVARGRRESVSAFGTPNVVHFCAALLVAGILTMPWSALWPAGVAIAVCGVVGMIYTAVVMRRARRHPEYQAVFEDWLWHVVLPALAYVTLFTAGLFVEWNSATALFAIGPAALLLVFAGIHNAWDAVTFLMIQGEPGTRPGEGPRGAEPASHPAPAAGGPREPAVTRAPGAEAEPGG